MPDKNVRVRMSSEGSSDVRRDIEKTSAAADDFGKKDVKAKIGLVSKVAETLKDATSQINIWGKKKEDATIGVEKSKDMDPTLKDATSQIDTWGKKKEDATIGVEKSKDADPTLKDAEARVDSFGRKREDATVGVEKADDTDVILGEFTRVLHDVTDKFRKARIGVDDSEGKAALIDFGIKLRKTAEGIHKAKIGVEGERKALADIYRLDAALDKFGRKRETAHLGTSGGGSSEGSSEGNGHSGIGSIIGDVLGGLFGGGGGGGGLAGDVEKVGENGGKSFMTAFSTGITSSGVIIQTVIITVLLIAIAATLPAIVPAAIALGAGIGGVIFAAMGKSKASQDFKKNLMGTFSGLKDDAAKAALPMIHALTPVLKQVGEFGRQLEPVMKAMFAASIPSLKMFVMFLEKSAKVLLPAFTQVIRQLTPSLPMLSQGLMAVVRGFVGFLHAIGPAGIKGGMSVLLQILKAVGTVLDALGHVAAWVAEALVKASEDSRKHWEQLAHWFESFWKSLQKESKEIAGWFVTAWNAVFHAGSNTVHFLMKAWDDFDHALHTSTNAVFNFLKGVWDGMKTAFKAVVNALHTAWESVTSFFKSAWNNFWNFLKSAWNDLKSSWKSITNALHSAWQDVVSFFKSAWNNFWSGLKSLWGDLKSTWKNVTSFLKSAWGDVTSFFKTAWNSFWNFLKGVWGDLKSAWKSLSSTLKSVWSDVTSFFKSAWNNFWTFLKGVWSDLRTSWNNITDSVKAAWHDVETSLTSSWHRLKGIASSVWGDIKSAVSASISFIINDVWDPFAKVINAVLGFLHLGKNPLPTPTIHAGGGGGLQAEANFAEGGIVPGPPVRADIVPAMLTPGERVLSLPQVARMGGHSAIDSMVGKGTGGPTHFAGGGRVGGRGSGDLPANPNSGGQGISFGSILSGLGGIGSGLLHAGAAGALTLIDKLGPLSGEITHLMVDKTPGGNSPFNNMAEGLVSEIIKAAVANATAAANSKLGGGSGTGAAVAKYAASYATGKNHPYVFGGSSPHGWDCSGFAAWVYEKFKFFKERQGVRHGTSESMFHDPLLKSSTEQPGALVFFNTHDGQPPPSHVGIVVRKGFYAGADDPAVGTIIAPDAGNMGFRIPKSGFGTTGGGPASPGLMTVANFLLGHGFSRAASAGIAGTVAGESGGNPESVGSGGGGLIGWTPVSSAYPIKNIITGHADVDMGHQLTDMVAYIERNGSIADMNTYTNPIAAADHFSQHYERPAVTDSDVRPSTVMSIFNRLGGAAGAPVTKSNKTSATTARHLANGGWITEPIFGMGLNTGAAYSFGENEPEQVTPLRNLPGGNGGGDCIHITVQGDTDPDAAAVRIHQRLRRLKKKRGGQKLGLD